MKRYLLVTFLILSYYFSFAQKIDSLLTLLKTDKEDTNKVIHLYQISNKCNEEDILKYAQPALALSEKLNFKKGIANALSNIGFVYMNQEQLKEALDYFRRSLKLQEEINNKEGIADLLHNIGLIYKKQGKIKEALNYYYRSLKIQEEINNREGIAASLNNIGFIYKNQGQIKKALDYYSRSLKIQQEINDKEGIAGSLNNIGFIYKHQGQLKEALDYFHRSLKIREEMTDKRGIAIALSNIGLIYDIQGHIKEALNYYHRSLKIQEEINDKEGIANSLNILGVVYFEKKDYLHAIAYGDSSLKIAQTIGYPINIRDAAQLLCKAYKACKQWQPAFEMNELYITMRDSVVNIETKKAGIEKQMQYEFDKKETELIAKAELEQTITEAQNKQKQLIYGSVILLIIITAFFMLNRQKLKSKKDKIIFEKQEALLQAEKQKVEDELLHAKKLLDNYTENLIDKNKAIEELQFENEKLKGLKAAEIYKEKIDNLDDLNNATILTNEDWDKFKDLFEQVYKGFFIRLKDKLPNLTNAEIRLMSLIKLNLDTKQMANMLGVSPETITKTKYRLRKKVSLTDKQDIDLLVQSI